MKDWKKFKSFKEYDASFVDENYWGYNCGYDRPWTWEIMKERVRRMLEDKNDKK